MKNLQGTTALCGFTMSVIRVNEFNDFILLIHLIFDWCHPKSSWFALGSRRKKTLAGSNMG